MPGKRDRRRIAMDAARLLYERQETEVHAARLRAAVMNGLDPRRRPRDLPTGREIRACVDELTLEREGDAQPANARERHLATLKLMWKLERFQPRCPAPAPSLERLEAPVELRLSAGTLNELRTALEREGWPFIVEDTTPPRAAAPGLTDIRFHLRSSHGDVLDFRLQLCEGAGGDRPRTGSSPSAGGTAAEPSSDGELSVSEMERWVEQHYPDASLEELRVGAETWADPYVVFELLLRRLEGVKQKPEHHPEGDALYHSLQAFDRAREQFPYDEEFLQAALMHDVGKGIDPSRHVEAGLAALRGLISPRTAFLIEFHSAARQLRDGTLTGRLRHQLLESEWHADLMALLEVDDQARRPGIAASTLEEALAYMQSLNGW